MLPVLQNEWLKLHRHLHLLWAGALAFVVSGFMIQRFCETALRVYTFWAETHPERTFAFFFYDQVNLTLSFLQFLLACLATVAVFDTETAESLIQLTRLLPVSGLKVMVAKLLYSMSFLLMSSSFMAALLVLLQQPFLSYMNAQERLGIVELGWHYGLRALLMLPVSLLAALITTCFFGKPLAVLVLSMLATLALMAVPALPYSHLFWFSPVNAAPFDLIDMLVSIGWTVVLSRLLYKQYTA
ncbi:MULTISPECIES: ABC transporter permease [unclassified Spirosoma]|uniref:ABC transporter permease n=1 Tax=unclassified Spirosoma TaxID=2621999 RepID=UPI00095C7089|nr:MULTISPECIES: ABC transporter permease [unclassified Spirosoma]MBN8823133.1 ABC transporter permease [Spirosoma sp.]OJW73220.1 MAG: hypothetical protein BGO59_06980 [Spirosoma sp. 48-14]